jgi:hypothetical protein
MDAQIVPDCNCYKSHWHFTASHQHTAVSDGAVCDLSHMATYKVNMLQYKHAAPSTTARTDLLLALPSVSNAMSLVNVEAGSSDAVAVALAYA